MTKFEKYRTRRSDPDFRDRGGGGAGGGGIAYSSSWIKFYGAQFLAGSPFGTVYWPYALFRRSGHVSNAEKIRKVKSFSEISK